MTTTDHTDKVKQLRTLLRTKVCGTLSVRMGKGTAWGNVHVRGSGKFGEFTLEEAASLKAAGYAGIGANCYIIAYGDVGAAIVRLSQLPGISRRHLAKCICGDGFGLNLSCPIHKHVLKLSGNMVDATDRDLLGNPTLEGAANVQTFPHTRPDGRTVRVTVPVDEPQADDRITALKQVMTHVDSLLSAAYQSTADGMLPPQVSDARKALQKAIREG